MKRLKNIRSKYIAAVLPLLLVFAVGAREAHEEWSARQMVEAKSRAMFSGQPMVEKSAQTYQNPASNKGI